MELSDCYLKSKGPMGSSNEWIEKPTIQQNNNNSPADGGTVFLPAVLSVLNFFLARLII